MSKNPKETVEEIGLVSISIDSSETLPENDKPIIASDKWVIGVDAEGSF